MIKKCIFLFCFFSFYLFGSTEEKFFHEIQNHLLIGDVKSAKKIAKKAVEQNPQNQMLGKIYIQVLAKNLVDEKELFKRYREYIKQFPKEKGNRNLLEEICWAILTKASESRQYSVRLAALIGAYKSKDAKAIDIFLKLLDDPNAIIRSIAVQFSCHFLDMPLKKKIRNRYENEKLWLVKIELIRALGSIKAHEKLDELKKIIASSRSTFEEKKAATSAILQLNDSIDLQELKHLAKSSREGLRRLACEIAVHFQIKQAKEDILSLLSDPITDVRIAALSALGLFFHEFCDKKELIGYIKHGLEDENPLVSITASWLAMRIDEKLAEKSFRRWLDCDFCEYRWLAGAALALTGKKGVLLSSEYLQKSKDPYLSANLALGLIGQRREIKKCCDTLYSLLENEPRKWMMETYPNTIFSVLCPSKIRHVDQIPNYPEAIDQMTRISVLSILAILEDPRAEKAMYHFLKKKHWAVTGFAAATLLQEGSEEALEVIRQHLRDPESTVRLHAALALALFGKEQDVLPIFEKEYNKVDYATKMQIFEVLGYIGNEKNYDFFLKGLQEPFFMLRVVSAGSFLQCLHR